MRIVQPYKHLNRLIQNESLEPRIRWAFRMAIAAMVPLIWGLYTGKLAEAGWIALAAECICWIELKGDFQQKLNLLAGGSVLATIFAVLGSASGNIIWLSIALVAFVGFLTSILKSLGDRGSGLALSVFALFIFCNAYPVKGLEALTERTELIFIGAAWNAVVAIASFLFTPAQEPYRRSIAIVFKSIAELVQTLSNGWEGKGPRSNEHDIYLKEKEIRNALDASLDLFEKTAHEAGQKDGHEFNLAHARKAVALVGAQMITVSQELSNISINRLETDIRIKVFTILRATQQTLDRMAAYTISLDAGEELILKSRIYRLYKLIVLLREALKESDIDNSNLQRFVQLSLRNTKLLESSFNNIREVVNERSVLRTYPFMKTFYILHPKYWWQYLRLLFNFNSFTVKYAVRTATASAIAMFIYKWWNIDHGYWIPFTVLILMQTYFGATIKKARDRILGTLAGGLVAGLFLKLPTGLYLQEALLFLSFIPMIIYLRKRYSWAVFFITINLILLFSINREISDSLILIRGLSTIAGAGIAIVAGFALLPTWDKNLLPIHLAEAIKRNHHYFLATFFPNDADVNWTKHKRLAESGNNNAFDSFTRYMQEPGFRKKPYAIFYQILTHNIRITRELNNIRLEQDSDSNLETNIDTVRQQERINETLDWFNKNTAVLKQLDPNIISPTIHTDSTTITLSAQQEIYLEKMLIELKAMNEDLLILAEKLPRIMRL